LGSLETSLKQTSHYLADCIFELGRHRKPKVLVVVQAVFVGEPEVVHGTWQAVGEDKSCGKGDKVHV
jgi:hypothetical protein